MNNIIIIISSFLLAPSFAFAQYGDSFSGRHMNMSYGFLGGGFLMILFWILVIVGIVYLVKHISDNERGSEQKGDRAIGILKERYAKGEISKEEFEEKKKELL